MVLELSKISSKGQITIPIEIRKSLGISSGDRIIFERKDGNMVIKKAEEKSLVSVLVDASPLSENTTKALKKLRVEWD